MSGECNYCGDDHTEGGCPNTPQVEKDIDLLECFLDLNDDECAEAWERLKNLAWSYYAELD